MTEDEVDQAWKDIRWANKYIAEWKLRVALAFVLGCLLGMLVACGDSSKPPAPNPHPLPSPAVWQFQYSPGMSVATSYGNNGFVFAFPATNGAHYLVQGHSGAISKLSINYQIDTTGTPVFDYRTAADNTCGPGYPGTATLYFQSNNDWYGEYGRWFAQNVKQELAAGAFSMTAEIADADKWVSVYGKSDAVQIQAAAGNATSVGVVFGGGCFAGHGVFVTGGGATMTASMFEVQ